MNQSDFAWAVGLFEGEGHFTIWRSDHGQKRIYLRMGLDMTDRDVVERFAQVVGVGALSGPYSSKGARKPKWRWSATASVARELVERPGFRELLGNRRRERLDEILALVDAQPPLKPRNADQTHCKHGHPFDQENTYITPRGNRVCRACGKVRYQRWMERHGISPSTMRRRNQRVPDPEERERLLLGLLEKL